MLRETFNILPDSPILLFTSSTAYYDIDDSLLYKIEFPGIGKDSKGLHGGTYQFIHSKY